MEKFDFHIYKGTKQYFLFFDVYIKKYEKNKDVVFKKLFINNASYRRARSTEQNIGKEIIEKLASFYGLSVPTNDEIDLLEYKATIIYNNIYYKNDSNIDLDYLEKMISKNNLLLPIYNLLNLFLIVNTNKSPKMVKEDYKDFYLDIKKYKSFYSVELSEILEILSLFFDDSNDEGFITNFNNPMSYQIIASKYYAKEKYIEAIFFSMQAREALLKDQNFKRYIVVNHTLMSSLLYNYNYKECFDIAKKHLMCVESLNLPLTETNLTKKYLYVSLLGLGDYERIIQDLYNDEVFNLTTLTCLLVSLYCVSRDKYYKYLNNNIIMDELEDKQRNYIKCLNDYLQNKDVKAVKELNQYDIMGSLISILKKMSSGK